jgi:hypothetical protein
MLIDAQNALEDSLQVCAFGLRKRCSELAAPLGAKHVSLAPGTLLAPLMLVVRQLEGKWRSLQ